MCVWQCGSGPFTCSLYSTTPSAVAAADGSLVPEHYVTRRSDRFSTSDSDPDVNCTPLGKDRVSCPAPGRLFDKIELSENSNATRHLFHLWQSTRSGEYVEVELVFCWPVTIGAMTWYFWQDAVAFAPPSDWTVTAMAENGSNISQAIAGVGQSSGLRYPVEIDNISGFPAARHWRIIIPLHPTEWLFLYEVSINGKVERIGECKYRQEQCRYATSVALFGRCCIQAMPCAQMQQSPLSTMGVILCML